MKKKLLASLVIIASAQSNAAIELHNSETVNLTLSGSAEVQYHKDSFNLKEKKFYNQDAKIRFDDGDLAFLVTTPISNTMKGFAGIEFNFKDKKTVNDGLYVGVKDEKSTLTAGRTVLLADDSGVGVGYESELGFTNQNGENTDLFMTTQSDQVIKYKYDNKSFWAGVSYSTDDEISSKKDKKNKVDREVYELASGLKLGNFGFAAYIQDGNAENEKTKSSQFTYQVETTYKIDTVALGASYSNSDLEYNTGKTSLDLIKLSGKYTTGKTAFGIGYDLGKIESGKDRVDLNNFYANATYAFNSNLKAYGEIGYLSSDELEKAIKSSGADLGVNYTVGAEFSF